MNKIWSNTTEQKHWPWYKAFITAFIHPSVGTANRILTESNISVVRSVLWFALASVIISPIYMITMAIKTYSISQTTITTSIWHILFDVFASAIASVITNIIMAGLVHVIVRFFTKKGTWQNLFILNNIFFAPYFFVFYLIAFLVQFTANTDLVLLCIPFVFFILLYIIPLPIRAIYHIRWIWAALVSGIVLIPLSVLFLLISMPGMSSPK